MIAVDDATPTLGAAPACRVLGLPRASLYRGRRPAAVARPRPAPPRALDPIERQGVLDLLHTRFIDQAPAQVHATLLDEGTYLCSPRTMYRVLDDAHEIKERRDQVRRPHYAAPELLATRPNEVWSWDITKLLGPAKWTYFYLYVILDIFSRYVVGWMLAPHESAALAERLIAETCAKHGIQPGQLTLHADRGGVDAEQTRGAAAGRPRRDQDPQPPARVERQSVFGSAVQDAEVLSTVSGAIRIARGRARVWAGLLSLVQPRPPSQRPGVPHARRRALRPSRHASARSGSRCSRPPTRRIPSASSTAGHTPRICRPPCGSTRRRRKRPLRMPQERRSSPRTTCGSTRSSTPTHRSPS